MTVSTPGVATLIRWCASREVTVHALGPWHDDSGVRGFRSLRPTTRASRDCAPSQRQACASARLPTSATTNRTGATKRVTRDRNAGDRTVRPSIEVRAINPSGKAIENSRLEGDIPYGCAKHTDAMHSGA